MANSDYLGRVKLVHSDVVVELVLRQPLHRQFFLGAKVVNHDFSIEKVDFVGDQVESDLSRLETIPLNVGSDVAVGHWRLGKKIPVFITFSQICADSLRDFTIVFDVIAEILTENPGLPRTVFKGPDVLIINNPAKVLGINNFSVLSPQTRLTLLQRDNVPYGGV